jgi:hypothetical protein
MYDSSTSTWGSIEDLSSGITYYQYYPSVGTDARGHIYVAWHGGSPYKIYMTTKNPLVGTWTTPELVTAGSQYSSSQYYPSTMDFNSNNFAYTGMGIVWGGYSSGSYNTMFYCTDDFYIGKVKEFTDSKMRFDVTAYNIPPIVIMPSKVEFLPDDTVRLPVTLKDQGSDDLFLTVDWGDYASTTRAPTVYHWYNNGLTPEPGYNTATGVVHSALNGTAPFEVNPELYHTYAMPGKFVINMTIWDDDEMNWGMPGTNYSLPVEVLSPYRIKEVVIRELEQLLPGRLDYVGYDTITLKYVGDDEPTIMVYNHISRPPFYWETKLLVTFCNVTKNDTLFINGSFTTEGMFGDQLLLKLYDESLGLIDITEIDTVYTCLEPIKIGQFYEDFEVMNFTRVEGQTYHHYSKYALRTEDALDHVLRSINRDPRRGYGWWHEYWAWWCGYTVYRGLWIDDRHLDPQFGAVVFCEERAAVLALMEVLKNCLDPRGVQDITFRYTGKPKVDVEIYMLKDFWMGGWEWHDAAYDIMPGQSFKITPINAHGVKRTNGMLANRIMMRVYHATSGEPLDTIYIRSSGEWFLEVEPDNIYGAFTITDSTLLVGTNKTCWDTWWGGDSDWWDWFFGFWYWEQESFRSSTRDCGWNVSECFDAEAAAEEQARICENQTMIKQLINMLVRADDFLVRVQLQAAENATVTDPENDDEYMYHLKWSKRYWYRGFDHYKKGRPHRAISDFKIAWRHSVLAIKWANKKSADPAPSEDDLADPCGDCLDKQSKDCGWKCNECEEVVTSPAPWWMDWYFNYRFCCPE